MSEWRKRTGLESGATLYATVCCIRDIRHNIHSVSQWCSCPCILLMSSSFSSCYTCCLPLKFTYLLSSNVCIIRRAFCAVRRGSSSSVEDGDGDYDGGTVTAKVKTRHAVFTLLHYIFSVAAVLYVCRVHFTGTVHGLNDFRALTSLCTTTILGGWDV